MSAFPGIARPNHCRPPSALIALAQKMGYRHSIPVNNGYRANTGSARKRLEIQHGTRT
jgi:hypothetical protein